MKITTGLIQGLFFVHFLFLIYINDLPEYVKNSNQVARLADDSSAVKASKRKECQIQEDIDKLTVWFAADWLTVNSSKCEVKNFGLGGQQCIFVMNRKIPQKAPCTYLGLK